MDTHVSEHLHLILHLLLLSFFSTFSLRTRTRLALIFSFTGYVCSVVMQFSALHDSHRSTRSFFT